MPRKKTPRPTEYPFLTEPLFRFVDAELTEANYIGLVKDLHGMGKPSFLQPTHQMNGCRRDVDRTAECRCRRPKDAWSDEWPTLETAKEMQTMFREDLASWFGDPDPGLARTRFQWRRDLRCQFQMALFHLVPSASSVRSRWDPRCAHCKARFTPRLRGQTTCGKLCRDRHYRETKALRKPAARA